MVKLRAAKAEDLEALIDLLHLLFTLEQDFLPDVERQRQGLNLLLRSDTAHVVVAEVKDKVVAMASLQLLISTAEGGAAGLVEDVVVNESWRGRGIGKALLTHLAEWAEARGVSRLQLLADRDNLPALDFYRGQGWSTTRLVAMRKCLSLSSSMD